MNGLPQSNQHMPPHKTGVRLGYVHFSAVELLVTLILLFCVSPFIEGLKTGELIGTLLMTAVLVAAVLAVGGQPRHLLKAGALAFVALAGKWGNHFHPATISPLIFAVTGLCFIGYVVVLFLGYILRAKVVNVEVLCASVSIYLMLGLLWSLAYRAIDFHSAGNFAFPAGSQDRSMTAVNAFYFSFVTLSTVGYGDITPVSKVARMLAVMEAVTGLFYMAVLVARLVSIHSAMTAPEQSPGHDSDSDG